MARFSQAALALQAVYAAMWDGTQGVRVSCAPAALWVSNQMLSRLPAKAVALGKSVEMAESLMVSAAATVLVAGA